MILEFQKSPENSSTTCQKCSLNVAGFAYKVSLRRQLSFYGCSSVLGEESQGTYVLTPNEGQMLHSLTETWAN